MKVLRWLEAACGILTSLAGGVAIVYLLTVPIYAGESCQAVSPGEAPVCVTDLRATLLRVNGATAVVDLSIIAILVLGVAAAAIRHSQTSQRGARRALWGMTGMFAAFTVLALFSIGALLLPSAGFALVACAFSLGHGPTSVA